MTTIKHLLMMLLCIITAHSFSQNNNWIAKTNAPISRSNAASCVLNNKIYVVGGVDLTGTALNTLQVYDPSSNSWSSKTGMSIARNDLSLAAVSGKLYAIGGYDGSNAVNIVEEYDPTTDTWTTKTSMPTSRSTFSVGVINNKIYAVGGWSGNYTAVEEYTPSTDSWATKTSIPQGRGSDNSIQVIGNTLYYIGGKNINTNTTINTCYKYNQLTDTWSAIANLPQAVWAGATATLGSKIHYFGGGNGTESSVYNYHFVYDTLSNSWSTDTLMTSPRADFNCEIVNGNIYLIGGRNSSLNVLNIVEAINYCPLVSITPIPSFIDLYAPNLKLIGNPLGGMFSGKGVVNDSLKINAASLGKTIITYSYSDANGCVGSASQDAIIYDTLISIHVDTIHHYDTLISIHVDTIHHYDTLIVHLTETIHHYDTTKISVEDTLIVHVSLTGIAPPNNFNTFKIYPNPASDHININCGNYTSMTRYTIKITNSIGQNVYSGLVNQQVLSIDLNTWSGKGIYFLNIYDAGNNLIDTKKILLQ